tara:strand:- start:254 stop:454 length:201 start_codon:yes stop_codon:yes gene_type:complete
MTEELEGAMDLHRKVVNPQDAVALHSLELLLDVASNLLADTTARDRILSIIKLSIHEEKLHSTKKK